MQHTSPTPDLRLRRADGKRVPAKHCQLTPDEEQALNNFVRQEAVDNGYWAVHGWLRRVR